MKFKATFMTEVTQIVEGRDLKEAEFHARKFINAEAKKAHPTVLLRIDHAEEVEPQTS